MPQSLSTAFMRRKKKKKKKKRKLETMKKLTAHLKPSTHEQTKTAIKEPPWNGQEMGKPIPICQNVIGLLLWFFFFFFFFFVCFFFYLEILIKFHNDQTDGQ